MWCLLNITEDANRMKTRFGVKCETCYAPPAAARSSSHSLYSFTEFLPHFSLLSDFPPTWSRREETDDKPFWKPHTDMTPCLRLPAHILRAFYARKIGLGNELRSLSAAIWHTDHLRVSCPCPPALRIPSLFISPLSLDVNSLKTPKGKIFECKYEERRGFGCTHARCVFSSDGFSLGGGENERGEGWGWGRRVLIGVSVFPALQKVSVSERRLGVRRS